MNEKELFAKYDGMTIEQICKHLNGRFANMRESQRSAMSEIHKLNDQIERLKRAVHDARVMDASEPAHETHGVHASDPLIENQKIVASDGEGETNSPAASAASCETPWVHASE